MHRRLILGLVTGILIGAVVGWQLRHAALIDACLDRGGMWREDVLTCKGLAARGLP